MNVIGVTGPSGAGKSELCRLVRKMHIPFIDADEVYHSLLVCGSECTIALTEEFGEGILDENGVPDRNKLGAIVFSSKEKLEKLNEIVLHFVIDNIKTTIAALERAGVKNVVVDAPTLIESGFDRECDTVISVLAPKEERLRRILLRDGITQENAKKRIDAQKKDEFYIENSDVIIENSSTAEDFLARAEEVLKTILK